MGGILWDSLGIVIDTIHSNSGISATLTINNGVLYCIWQNYRNGNWDIRGVRVNEDGSIIRGPTDGWISATTSYRGLLGTVASKDSSFICVWQDFNAGGEAYCQRIRADGTRLWDSSDVRITAMGVQSYDVISDSGGGIIFAGKRDDFAIIVQQVGVSGELGEVVTEVQNEIGYPSQENLQLLQNYPNPFNSSTQISWVSDVRRWINIDLLSVTGQRVASLFEGFGDAGTNSITVDLASQASGVYIVRLKSLLGVTFKKITIIR
jgi:hypothetical protein